MSDSSIPRPLMKPSQMEPLPFLQLPTGSSSFLFDSSASSEVSATDSTAVSQKESGLSETNNYVGSPSSSEVVTISANNDGDFDDLQDFQMQRPQKPFSTDTPTTTASIKTSEISITEKLHNAVLNDIAINANTEKSRTDVPALPLFSSVTTSSFNQQDPDDIIQFHTPTHQTKEITLSTGKTFLLKAKPPCIAKPLNTLELSRQMSEQQGYGLNINDLYVKLEQDRLKNKNSNINSYLTKAKKSKSEKLWVEKWRPKKYMDFIGNEQTNRKILHWFKQWDRVVFQKNFKPITVNNSTTNLTSSTSSTSSSSSFSRFQDPFGRPQRKVLLLSGPPGLGKTSIAHIISKMCGYDLMEINASDERSGQRIRDKVVNSLNSVTFSGKPTCLVADEVDGAAEFGFVKVLLDILNDDSKTLARFQKAGDSVKFLKEKGKNRPKFLLRPIVAICNDVYAPALEKLRPMCELVQFKQVNEKSLIDRLRFIATNEELSITTSKLKEIVTLTDCDIRSCLNLLQFGGDLSTTGDHSRRKDMQISWYTIVNCLFQKDAKTSKSDQYKRLYEMISVNANYDKIIHGCFQAYVTVHYQDLKLSKPSMISDWLYFSDLMSKTQFDTTAGNISDYSKETALQFFELFADLSNKSTMKIGSDYEHFERQKTNNNIVKLLHSNTSAQLRSLLKLQTIPMEILPYLTHIITPEIKPNHNPVNTNVPSINLKPTTALQAIDAFGLKIHSTKDENFNDIMTTYPEFTNLAKFDKSEIRKQQVKQTASFPGLLREMEHQRTLKRSHSEMTKSKKDNENDSDSDDDVGETSFQVLKGQYEKIAEAEQRFKKPKTEIKVWIKYHEGFSNAVRKKVRWDDLFGCI